MSRRRAPTAILRPISRVRSVTETSMMFMMPMPPTTSEIAAVAASSQVSVCCAAVRACTISATFRTRKSSCSPGLMRRRWRSRSTMSSSARDKSDWSATLTRMEPGLVGNRHVLTGQPCPRGRKRNEHDIVLIALPAGLSAGLHHADHLEGRAGNPDRLPDRDASTEQLAHHR